MGNPPPPPKLVWQIFRVSLVTLPYLYYVSMVGLVSLLIFLLVKIRKTALDPLTHRSLLLISGLLIASTIFAVDRGEALLQLANFLPFFVFFALLPSVLQGVAQLERVALDLVLATLPINLISVFEYILKAPWMPRNIRLMPFVAWVRSAPHKGRAMVMFDHPNALASYLVLILGLGLGLLLYSTSPLLKGGEGGSKPRTAQTTQTTPCLKRWSTPLLVVATFANLVGIFCSGSRNGLVIAIAQVLVFSLLVRGNRLILWTGLVSLIGFIAGALALGIGGRSLSISDWTNDPRVRVWQIALELIGDRPWLGWGLGNYKILYPSFPHDPEYDVVFHPHNFWLLLGAEAGIPVAIAFTVWVGYLCYRAVRVLLQNQLEPPVRSILLAYLLGFAGCIAFAFFDVTFYDARTNIVDWVLLAGIYSLTQSLDFN